MNSLIVSSLLIAVASVHSFPHGVKPGVQPLSAENLHKLKNLGEGELPWVYSGQYQGDMVLSEAQAMSINSRNGIVDVTRRWPKVIPYVMEQHVWAEQKYIRKAMDHLEMLSCLKFVPRTNEETYIEITNEEGGCFAYVGMSPGSNRLNIAPPPNGVIGDGCMLKSLIHHELLHTLGFHHMQSSWDRDDYVEIQWDNISEGSYYQFEKFNDSTVTHFGIPYDYRSVMHYPRISNAIDWEKPTIITKDPAYQNIIGQDAGISRRDVERLNLMYDCPF